MKRETTRVRFRIMALAVMFFSRNSFRLTGCNSLHGQQIVITIPRFKKGTAATGTLVDEVIIADKSNESTNSYPILMKYRPVNVSLDRSLSLRNDLVAS